MEATQPSLSGFRRMAAIVTAFCVIAMWMIAVSWWPELPNRIPMHFDFAGQPNRYDDRSMWWILPGIATAIGGLMSFLGLWIPSRARHSTTGFSVPEPKLYNKLSPERRVQMVEPLALALNFLGAFIVACFTILMNDMARIATNEITLLPSWPLWIFLPIVLGTVLGVSIGTKKRIRTAAKEDGILP